MWLAILGAGIALVCFIAGFVLALVARELGDKESDGEDRTIDIP